MIPRPSSASRPLRTSVVAGLVLALLTLLAGGAYALTRQPSYTAESVLVVLPRTGLDDATSAAFYETMSRGQIVGTFAEVANNPGFQRQALDGLGLDARQRDQVSTAVSVVPDTSVILVRVTAGTAEVATAVADATAERATTYLGTLTTAYRTQKVQAGGAVSSSGLTPALVLVLAAVVALTLGVAVQQAVYHLLAARGLAVGEAGDPAPASAGPARTNDGLSLAGRP